MEPTGPLFLYHWEVLTATCPLMGKEALEHALDSGVQAPPPIPPPPPTAWVTGGWSWCGPTWRT